MQTRYALLLLVIITATPACAQTEPATSTASTTSAPAPIDSTARATLQMLHDRRATLKDFTTKLSYEVYHPKTDDQEGKLGTVTYAADPAAGPRFFIHSSVNTVDRKPFRKIDEDINFDGTTLTTIDHKAKRYERDTITTKGATPGAATSLDGPLPLPIGLDVEDVIKSFDVTVLPGAPAGQITLRLVPRPGTRFDFTQLDVTVDQGQQLPMKIVQTAKNGDVTTIEFSDPVINSGKAVFPDTTPPTAPGWDITIK